MPEPREQETEPIARGEARRLRRWHARGLEVRLAISTVLRIADRRGDVSRTVRGLGAERGGRAQRRLVMEASTNAPSAFLLLVSTLFLPQFILAAAALLSTLALAEPLPLAGDAAAGTEMQARGEPFFLSERACNPSNCPCNGIQGQFCTNGINPGCIKGHVYECQAGTGKTCDYGYRKSCAECGELQC
ncbi:hypothetical protein A1Q1_03097 [Trichosporon asahii var. asahii CBS 2479]|uniref:Uncharacterized protein n=1 Tax=Trichosporon asahii var. asahii (strain ATCC 90039 / CBS 2479 / JCM 2466 / KCTC 7840 / NBRC 103889/ NCYC 2677 / UAMH 7654) TaxID=1186058 RepID=J5RHB3_TRIAS|nr:hypothetical protein A1Q1_03097 [Trichosporon asahii var. asahii CBS 2479]EJT52643.1 hypothetical protein A1Q1_03097 [Trichosporon asahii var. asahii CBS 2479]